MSQRPAWLLDTATQPPRLRGDTLTLLGDSEAFKHLLVPKGLGMVTVLNAPSNELPAAVSLKAYRSGPVVQRLDECGDKSSLSFNPLNDAYHSLRTGACGLI